MINGKAVGLHFSTSPDHGVGRDEGGGGALRV